MSYKFNGYEFNGFEIPAYMMDAVTEYVRIGRVPGDFLRAVIENNLFEAVGRADSNNQCNLPAYVGFFYNEAPQGCYGFKGAVEKWCDAGGLEGVEKAWAAEQAAKQASKEAAA